MCVKNTTLMGVTMDYGHPLTTWVVEQLILVIGKTSRYAPRLWGSQNNKKTKLGHQLGHKS